MKKYLWLDDFRDPGNYISYEEGVSWVKNYTEFVDWISTHGLPDTVSFDHDIDPNHYAPPTVWDDFDSAEKWMNSQTFTEKTGLDCAKWLVNYCREKKCALPTWKVHSMNPVGKQRIIQELESYEIQN